MDYFSSPRHLSADFTVIFRDALAEKSPRNYAEQGPYYTDIKDDYAYDRMTRFYFVELVSEHGKFPYMITISLTRRNDLEKTDPDNGLYNSFFEDGYLYEKNKQLVLIPFPLKKQQYFEKIRVANLKQSIELVPIIDPRDNSLLVYQGNFKFIVSFIKTGKIRRHSKNLFVKKQEPTKRVKTKLTPSSRKDRFIYRNRFPDVFAINMDIEKELPRILKKDDELFEIIDSSMNILMHGNCKILLKAKFFVQNLKTWTFGTHVDPHDLYYVQIRYIEELYESYNSVVNVDESFFRGWRHEVYLDSLYEFFYDKMDREYFEGNDFLKRLIGLYTIKRAAIGDYTAFDKINEIYSAEVKVCAQAFSKGKKLPSDEIDAHSLRAFKNLVVGETYYDICKKAILGLQAEREKKYAEKQDFLTTIELPKQFVRHKMKRNIENTILEQKYEQYKAPKNERERIKKMGIEIMWALEDDASFWFDPQINKDLYYPAQVGAEINFRMWAFGPKGKIHKGRLWHKLQHWSNYRVRSQKYSTLSLYENFATKELIHSLHYESLDEAERILTRFKREHKDIYEAWWLHRLEEISHDDIAKRLSIKPHLSRKRVDRGDKYIKEYREEGVK